jgi:cytochrome c
MRMLHPVRHGLSGALVLGALFLQLGCEPQPRETDQPTALAGESAPTVFRSTLDGRVRVVTAQLGPQLWAAWDTEQAGLFKLWRDGVELDGAVYTGRHGPQPTSQGKAWLVASYAEPWRLLRGQRVMQLTPRYRGHRLHTDGMSLRYELRQEARQEAREEARIVVEETPAAVTGPDGVLGFERRFSVRGVPADASLVLDVPLGALDPARDVETDGRFEVRATFSETARSGRLWLRSGETRFVVWLREPPPFEPPTEEVQDVEPGVALVEQHDCLVCHGLELGTVGPGFRQISSRYSPEATSDLADRVIRGGSGVWGAAVMTPHPDLAEADAREMVGWILSLEADELEVEPPPLPSRGPFSGWGDFFAAVGRELSPANSPGDGLAVPGVHPSFDLETIRPPGFEPRVGGLDFLSDGRLVVSSWDPNGSVFLVDGLMEEPPAPGAGRGAAGLAEPLGVRVVDDEIYVLQKPELTRLRDTDADGQADEYETVAQDWRATPNFHEFAFGLAYRDGYFYATLATAILPGGASAPNQARDRGRVVRIAREDGAVDFLADGLRTPNGVGFGPGGRLYVTDNQGDWLPASKVLALDPDESGVFFGSRSVLGEAAEALPVRPPVVWLPQGEIGNSPGQPVSFDLGPYRGQLLHTDVTHGGLKRVFVEEVGGVLQGAVFRFSQGFDAGLNRVVPGPDGKLYVGGIGSNGNWGQAGKQRFGLQRLGWNGHSTFEMLAIRRVPDGLEVEFTEPVAAGSGNLPANYRVEQWRYEPTAEYGGPKIDLEVLTAAEVGWSDGRRRVKLGLPGLRPGRVVYVRLGRSAFTSESGSDLWATEAWYTLNALGPSAGEAR